MANKTAQFGTSMERKTARQEQVNKTAKTAMQIMGGANVPVYTLQHLTSTEKYQQGNFEKIVVPFVELGRGASCAVRYGEDCSSVSRKHAIIERNGASIIIRNLNSNNATLVNGNQITEKELVNGDEIQLSQGGPKLLFNTTPTGTSKMGFTQRLNLVMKQAVKPYKRISAVLAILLVLTIAGTGYGIYSLTNKQKILVQEQDNLRLEYEEKLAEMNLQKVKDESELQEIISEQKNKMDLLDNELKNVKQNLEKVEKEQEINKSSISGGKITGSLSEEDNSQALAATGAVSLIKPLYEDIYFLTVTVAYVLPDGKTGQYKITGTGFLLNDGKFVTARHVVEPWAFPGSKEELILASIPYLGGQLYSKVEAQSPNLDLKFSFDGRDFIVGNSKDEQYSFELGENTLVYNRGSFEEDWAILDVSKKGKTPYDSKLSQNLATGTNLHVVGYTFGAADQQSMYNLKPKYSVNTVSQDGIINGKISVTRQFDSGNSGGPAFVIDNNTAKVVGIISAGRGTSGYIVPISSISRN